MTDSSLYETRYEIQSETQPDSDDLDSALEGAQASGSGTLRRWVIVRHASAWRPPTDVYEADNRLIVMVEIAGMRDSEFNVVLHGQRLTISGLRRRMTTSDCAFHRLEIPFGEFRTEVELPWTVQRDDVTATYRDGFLRVELPHIPAQKIQIVNVDMDDADPDPTTDSEDTIHD